MKKNYDKKFRLFAVCFSAFMTLGIADAMAQSDAMDVDFDVVQAQGNLISKVSSNGRYGVGSVQTQEGYKSVWYDFETKECKVVEDVIELLNVDNDGRAVGEATDAEKGMLPIIWNNGELEYLPYPAEYNLGACVNTSTPDGSILMGLVWKSNTDAGYDAMPTVWKAGENGEMEYEFLPVPAEDWQALPPQQVVIWDVNEDATAVVGREVGWRGDVMMPSIWTTDENGEYQYKVIGSDIYFDSTKEHPGQFPQFEDMVTADPASEPDLYNEQLQEWINEVNEYSARCEEYFTGATIRPSSFNITDNGRFIAANIEYKEGTVISNTKALVIDTQNPDDLIIFGDATEGYAITDDGMLFYDSDEGLMVTNVLDQSVTYTFNDYMKNEYGVNISDVVPEDAEITRIIATSNKTSVMCTTYREGEGYVQYAVYAPGKVSVAENTADEDVVFAMRGNVLSSNVRFGDVKVFATDGRMVFDGASEGALDLSFLGKGIYLVKGIADNGVCKAIKAVVK